MAKSVAQLLAERHEKPMMYARFERLWPETEIVPAGTRQALADVLDSGIRTLSELLVVGD